LGDSTEAKHKPDKQIHQLTKKIKIIISMEESIIKQTKTIK